MEATGSRYGNLRQAITLKLVLTCHEAAAVVQPRLRTRMAVPGEVILRQRFCLGNECRAVFFLCSRCDRGQRYCSIACRNQARRRQRRSANRRHQQSPEGRLDHRDRQRQYRRRRAPARVTDQGSLSLTCPALSSGGPVPTRPVNVPDRPSAVLLPRRPKTRPGLRLRCRVCGRTGRFIAPFPRIPRRR